MKRESITYAVRQKEEVKGYFVKPENILKKKNRSDLFKEIMTTCKEAYGQFMCKGIPPEDARFALHIATQIKIDKTLKVLNVWLTGTYRVIMVRSEFYLQLDRRFILPIR